MIRAIRRIVVRFALMIEPQQGLSYQEQLAIAQRAEKAGFETLFRSDHYESFPGDAGQPTTDAWAVLAGLARDTARIGLGALVSPVLFRTPGNLAKVAVTVDEMSGGRVEIGVGAGWHPEEHRRHGFPFPEIAERADHLEETLEILHGLWDEPDGWSFLGKHYAVEDALFRPKPASLPARNGRRLPIIVGGTGSPRSFRLAARYADEFNLSSASPELAVARFAALDEAVRAAGRDPGSLTHSVMAGVLIGRDAEEVRRREIDLLRAMGEDEDAEAWFASRRARWIHGEPGAARDMVEQFERAGAERIMLQDFIARDLDMIDLAGEALIG
jgi:F420-dependent oxidoreductase-like protein